MDAGGRTMQEQWSSDSNVEISKIPKNLKDCQAAPALTDRFEFIRIALV